MDLKLYQCSHCGNIAYKVYDKGVPLVCCGEKMNEMKAGVTDAAQEKHVPVVEKNGDAVNVTVGTVLHPMQDEHYLPFLAITNENTVIFQQKKPGEAPTMQATLPGEVTAYEWCNLHGLWKA